MRLVQLALVAAVLAASSTTVVVTGDTPKPSDTNNQPTTPPPPPNNNNNTPPPGQTPVPKPTPPPANNNTPPPGQQTPQPSPTPSPQPSSPSPTTAAPPPPAATTATSQPNSTTAPVSNTNSSSTNSDAPLSSLPTPSPTPLLETSDANTTTSDDSGGMSAGGIIGIILAVLVVIGIAGFFGYRFVRARNDKNAHGNESKHFDYPMSGTNNSPHEVTIMGSQQTDYALSNMERESSQDMPIMAANNGSVLSSSVNTNSYASASAMQNTYNNNNNTYGNNNNTYGNNNNTYGNNNGAFATSNSSNNNGATSFGNSNNADASTATTKYNNGNANVTLYSAGNNASPPAFAKSTSRFLSGPDAESPPFKKTDVQLSRPSSVLLDEPMEFNHSFAESYAESYSESYSDRGYMSSFVQGMPGAEGLSVGAESAMGDALDRDTATQHENAHWLDAMRDTGDSYAMLEADAYGSERGSAISRFSTDSEYNEPRQL